MRLSICHNNLVWVISISIHGGVGGRNTGSTQLEQNK